VDTGSAKKMRQTKEQAFSDEVGAGSVKNMRPNKKPVRRP